LGMTWGVWVCPGGMRSPAVGGEGELRGQPAIPGSPRKWPLKRCVCVCVLDCVKEQATFGQRSTTCCTCLCQTWSHASGYPLWTWSKFTKRSRSQNGLNKLHTRSAGIITSVMNILIFQVSSHIFHDFSIPKVILHNFPDLENFNFKFHDFPDFSRTCTNPV